MSIRRAMMKGDLLARARHLPRRPAMEPTTMIHLHSTPPIPGDRPKHPPADEQPFPPELDPPPPDPPLPPDPDHRNGTPPRPIIVH
jgi:hypothetical protein